MLPQGLAVLKRGSPFRHAGRSDQLVMCIELSKVDSRFLTHRGLGIRQCHRIPSISQSSQWLETECAGVFQPLNMIGANVPTAEVFPSLIFVGVRLILGKRVISQKLNGDQRLE